MVLIGYKKCQPVNNSSIKLIAYFEIPEDAILIKPKNAINSQYCRYRVNKMILKYVEDMEGSKYYTDEIIGCRFTDMDLSYNFRMNELCIADKFDDNEDNILGYGFHIFLSKIKAEMHLLDSVYEGTYYYWNDYGALRESTNYKNGQKNGESKLFDKNGNLRESMTYHFNHLIGKHYYYENNQIVYIIDYDAKMLPTYNSKYT